MAGRWVTMCPAPEALTHTPKHKGRIAAFVLFSEARIKR